MEHNNAGDDLIEIIPDDIPDDDRDIKIPGMEKADSADDKTGNVAEKADGIVEKTDGAEKENDISAGKIDSADEAGALQPDNPEKSDTAYISGTDTEEKTEQIFTEPVTVPEEDDDIKIAPPIGRYGRSENENDDFSEELEEVEQEQQDYEIMEEIGDAIINQVDSENWDEIETDTEGIDDSNTGSEDNTDDDTDAPKGEETEGPSDWRSVLAGLFTKLPKWGYIVIGSVLVVVIFMLWLTMSAAGQGILVRIGSKYIANKVTYQPVTEVDEIEYIPEDDLEYGREEPETSPVPEIPDDYEVVTPQITDEPTPVPEEKNVYNILLIGEENIDSGSARGRSDLLMIASVNREQKKVKLTSILRDSLVSIPNHSDNKINAAYMMGGVSLLYETLKVNLGMEFDNYCLVNFESFEKIVDEIGGVDIELTAEEAAYLNRTNYISNPEFRTVTEGKNHLNGNQALGYCRIRKVPTADMQYMDIGRTSRQRRLMKEIFSNVSKMNSVEMMGFVNKCMPYLITDITSEQLEQFIPMLSSISPATFEELRLPVEGTYHDVRLRGMLVTQIDLEANTEALRKFIYGN
ncbi:MAG: LCP family protein [Lachnospiraceae bacterium]|nr:LCP family protein [Lachnospiraceae bacterium]